MKPCRSLPLLLLLGGTALSGCTGGRQSVFASDYPPASDEGIRQSVQAYWINDHADAPAPNIRVAHGVVSLTGTVDTPEMRVDAVRDAWQPAAVSEVVNQLHVAQAATQSMRKDDAMTIKLRGRLTFDRDIRSTEYSIETVNGTVYLMGVKRDDAELARVVRLAEGVAGRGKVVSYVRPALQTG